MKILLMGTGSIGSVISRHLSKEKKVSEIICASKDIKRAKEFIDTKNKKISLRKIDASNQIQLANAAKDADLIINASLPQFNEIIMKTALKTGINYQDLCSHLHDLRNVEQLKYHKKFQKENLIGLINTGVSPGITNLLAREAADKLENISEIKIRLLEEQRASELIYAWSPTVILDELTSPSLVYKNGRFRLSKPFGDAEEYEFPHPFGKRRVVNIYGDEIATIPLYIKTRNINLKSCGTEIEFSEALYRLGLFNKKHISLDGKKIVLLEFFSKIAPRVPSPKRIMELIKDGTIENAMFLLAVEAIGKESGKKIRIKNTVIFPDLKTISKKFPGATYISYPAGTSAVSFSKVISRIDSFGVFPPEALSKEIRKKYYFFWKTMELL